MQGAENSPGSLVRGDVWRQWQAGAVWLVMGWHRAGNVGAYAGRLTWAR